MISYEVMADVREELRSRYDVFMRDRHIPDVLATGLAVGAQFDRTEEGRFRVRFAFADRASLDKYLSIHVARLRADFIAHFPEGVTLGREVWSELRKWPH